MLRFMKWTKKVPTKPGWYWVRNGPGLSAPRGSHIVHLDETKRDGFTVACSGDDALYESKDFELWSDEPIPRPLGGDG